MTEDDDDWQRYLDARDDALSCWFTEQQQPPDRTYHPGCLVVMGVCVLLWLLVIIGAVNMYPR